MPILSHVFKKLQKKQEKPKKKQKRVQELVQQDQQKQKNKGISRKKVIRGASAMKVEHAHGAYNVIVRPHISEKSVKNNDKGKYVFEVYKGVNKQQAAKAIESIYKVKVESVNKIKMPQKPRRYLRHKSLKSRHDKVIVTLAKGQEIEVLPQ